MIRLSYPKMIMATCVFVGIYSNAYAESDMDQSRGELLYSTHCIACHTTQVHWRDQGLVKDWESLKKQVRRWQDNTRLSWDEKDIEVVSRYLNGLYYHFPVRAQDKAISLETH